MKPVPKDLIAFARIPKRERIGDWPQYRIYIRGVPGLLGAGYTDILVLKIERGWYICKRKFPYGLLGTTYHPTRDAAAAEIHLAWANIPEHVRKYLDGVSG